MEDVQNILNTGLRSLEGKSNTPRLDAEILLCYVLEWTPTQLITRDKEEVLPELESKFRELIKCRVEQVPIAYLVGEKEFYGLDFFVNESVLIPRPETELLVETALGLIPTKNKAVRIVDVGTGSGCIAVTLGNELRQRSVDAEIYALDICTAALEVARKNIDRHDLASKIKALESDWFSALTRGKDTFDLIVSNPPYVAEGSAEVNDSAKFEPALALYSGEEGLDAVCTLIRDSQRFLVSGGHYIFEIGYDQREAILDYCAKDRSLKMKFELCLKDLAGLDRIMVFRRS